MGARTHGPRWPSNLSRTLGLGLFSNLSTRATYGTGDDNVADEANANV